MSKVVHAFVMDSVRHGPIVHHINPNQFNNLHHNREVRARTVLKALSSLDQTVSGIRGLEREARLTCQPGVDNANRMEQLKTVQTLIKNIHQVLAAMEAGQALGGSSGGTDNEEAVAATGNPYKRVNGAASVQTPVGVVAKDLDRDTLAAQGDSAEHVEAEMLTAMGDSAGALRVRQQAARARMLTRCSVGSAAFAAGYSRATDSKSVEVQRREADKHLAVYLTGK